VFLASERRQRVQIDGRTVFDQSGRPKDLSKDGPSIAIARLPMTAGAHQVRGEIADTDDPDKRTQQWSDTVEFRESRERVVLFDTKAGFTLDLRAFSKSVLGGTGHWPPVGRLAGRNGRDVARRLELRGIDPVFVADLGEGNFFSR